VDLTPWIGAAVLALIILGPVLWAMFGGAPASVDPIGQAPDHGTTPRVLVRSYAAHQQSDAITAFQADASALTSIGYEPVSQSWAEGQWGGGAWLVALALCLIVIGLLVFAYMLIVKPDGTLTVTYARRDEAREEVAPMVADPLATSLASRLRQLDEARRAGLLTDVEYQARRMAIIESV
jgi:hypothetical protein